MKINLLIIAFAFIIIKSVISIKIRKDDNSSSKEVDGNLIKDDKINESKSEFINSKIDHIGNEKFEKDSKNKDMNENQNNKEIIKDKKLRKPGVSDVKVNIEGGIKMSYKTKEIL